jgi:Coenzyme PQQ synthesis protein D (PqqD)
VPHQRARSEGHVRLTNAPRRAYTKPVVLYCLANANESRERRCGSENSPTVLRFPIRPHSDGGLIDREACEDEMEIRSFSVNRPQVVQDAFQGEVVIVNLSTGCYYSLVNTGAALWRLLTAGIPVPAIMTSVAAAYNVPVAAVEPVVQRLISELQQEDLIKEDLPNQAAVAEELIGASIGASDAFEPPILAKYTDVQELLLLDPIHDVDETGWPAKGGGNA